MDTLTQLGLKASHSAAGLSPSLAAADKTLPSKGALETLENSLTGISKAAKARVEQVKGDEAALNTRYGRTQAQIAATEAQVEASIKASQASAAGHAGSSGSSGQKTTSKGPLTQSAGKKRQHAPTAIKADSSSAKSTKSHALDVPRRPVKLRLSFGSGVKVDQAQKASPLSTPVGDNATQIKTEVLASPSVRSRSSSKANPSIPSSRTKMQSAQLHPTAHDFNLPSTSGGMNAYLMPLVHEVTLPRTALTQNDVHTDFTINKAPASQLPIATFWTSVEPFLNPITEEDLLTLQPAAEEADDAYEIAPLGAYYTYQWHAADHGLPPPPPGAGCQVNDEPVFGDNSLLDMVAVKSNDAIHAPLNPLSWLSSERVSLGGVTERLLSALVQCSESAPQAKMIVKKQPGMEALHVSPAVIEDKVRQRLMNIGLLGREADEASNQDDEICATLKELQQRLKKATRINEARKKILLERARDWMGYQEYVKLLQTLEQGIDVGYTKKIKNEERVKKNGKDKKGLDSPNVNARGSTTREAEREKERDEKAAKAYQDLLMNIDRHSQLVKTIGDAFDQVEKDEPGRFFELPNESIYPANLEG